MILSTVISFLKGAAWDFVKSTWYVWVIAILCALLLGQCAKKQHAENIAATNQKNYEESQRKASELTKQYEIDEKSWRGEMEREIGSNEFLKAKLDSLNIKYKNIQQLRTYKSVRTIRDTVVEVKWEYVAGIKYYEINKEYCGLEIKGGFFEGDSVITLKPKVTTDLTFINTKQRPKKFLFFRYGKWVFNSIVINKCEGDSVINNAVFTKIKTK